MCNIDTRPICLDTHSISFWRIGNFLQLQPLPQIPPYMTRRETEAPCCRDGAQAAAQAWSHRGTCSYTVNFSHSWSMKSQRKVQKKAIANYPSPCVPFFSGTRLYNSLKWVLKGQEPLKTLGNLMMEGKVAEMLRCTQWTGLLVSSAGNSPSQPFHVQHWKQPEKQPGGH